MSGDHGGFCCADCAAAAARGEQSSCDGESCQTGAVDTMYGRPDPLAMVGGMPARRAQRAGGPLAGARGALTAGTFGGQARATGCATCGAPSVAQANGGRTTGCGCATQRPITGRSYVDPLALRSPLGSKATGRALSVARGRGTGDIYLGRPPMPNSTRVEQGFNATAVTSWLLPKNAETPAENAARAEVFDFTLRDRDETNAGYLDRLNGIYVTASPAQRDWMLAMSLAGYLPAGVGGSGVGGSGGGGGGGGGGGYTPPASDASIAMANTRQGVGESQAAWSARVAAFYASAPTGQRAWIDAERRAGRLPDASGRLTPPSGGGSGSGSGGGSTPGGTNAVNQQAVINGVVQAVASAGGTVLALVREANQHDADVRRTQAEEAAARIARNDSREAMLIAAVREAAAAGFDAQTAQRTLRNGDRTTAIAQLSGAQGRLAAAMGTATAFPGSATLASTIAAAQASVAATAGDLDRTAPPDLPTSNPLNTQAMLDALRPPTAPWWQQPVTWVLGGIALVVGVVAGRGRKA